MATGRLRCGTRWSRPVTVSERETPGQERVRLPDRRDVGASEHPLHQTARPDIRGQRRHSQRRRGRGRPSPTHAPATAPARGRHSEHPGASSSRPNAPLRGRRTPNSPPGRRLPGPHAGVTRTPRGPEAEVHAREKGSSTAALVRPSTHRKPRQDPSAAPP